MNKHSQNTKGEFEAEKNIEQGQGEADFIEI